MLQLARGGRLRLDGIVDIATLFTDLCQIANPSARNDRHRARLPLGNVYGRRPLLRIETQLGRKPLAQLVEHPADSGIIKLARNRRVDRNVLIRRLESDMISLPLFANVA